MTPTQAGQCRAAPEVGASRTPGEHRDLRARRRADRTPGSEIRRLIVAAASRLQLGRPHWLTKASGLWDHA
jgi:hypothetical protein